jgi:hypothetical protein
LALRQRPRAKGQWKQAVALSQEELQRESSLIDAFLERDQYALALGLMREWVVSLEVLQSGSAATWLTKKTRLPVERELGALAKLVECKYPALSQQHQEWGQFWKDLGDLRNKFAHHGMAPEEVKGEGNKVLRRVRERWERIKHGQSRSPLVGGSAGRLLVSPIGNRPGVLYSALELTKPDGCVVVCSEQSTPLIPEAVDRAGFRGQVQQLELSDPHGGFDEIKPLSKLETLSDQTLAVLLNADEVLANLTGGTTLMGIATQMLAERARDLQRNTRRIVLIDRRPGPEQDREPYVVSDCLWLDGEDSYGDA